MYSLELDLYKEGYTQKQYSCVDIPIGAACGYYNYDNYYLYGSFIAGKFNWERNSVYQNMTFTEYSKEALNYLGLKMTGEKIRDKESFFAYIAENIRKGKPVLIKVKYKYLYYSFYYKNDVEGDRYHLLVINKWNDNTEVVTVLDSSALHGIGIIDNDCAVMFPYNIEKERVWQFWKESLDESLQTNIDAENIYRIERIGEDKTAFDVFSKIEEKYNSGENTLVDFIEKFNDFDDAYKKMFEFFYKKFVGCLEGMFISIRYFLKQQNQYIPRLDQIEEEYTKERKIILNKLGKFAVAGISLSENTRKALTEKVKSVDQTYMTEIFSIVKDEFKEEKSEFALPLDIKPFVNNKAFKIQEEDKADISGTGIYFNMDKQEVDIVFKSSKTKFESCIYDTHNNFDNISCGGQKLTFKKDNYNKIMILACSEYGSYTESIKLCCDDEEVEEVPISVSDFYQAPLYGEKTFCRGESYQIVDGKAMRLDFVSKIFIYPIYTSEKEFNEIILPNRKNIHIFAITLEK